MQKKTLLLYKLLFYNTLGAGISPGVASSAVKQSGSNTSMNPDGSLEENNKMLQVLITDNHVIEWICS